MARVKGSSSNERAIGGETAAQAFKALTAARSNGSKEEGATLPRRWYHQDVPKSKSESRGGCP